MSSFPEDDNSVDPRPAVPSMDDLRRMMHSQPELSPQRLQEIRQKLLRGDYLTRGTAEESAQRLVNDGDVFPPIP